MSTMSAVIYVTDDEAAFRSAVIKRLSQRHHRVTGFDSGDALLTALDTQAPDLILLDLKLAGQSGSDMLKTIRLKSPRSLIIMMTAYGTVQDAVDAMKLGAHDFLIKSVDLKSIDQAVDRAVGFVSLP